MSTIYSEIIGERERKIFYLKASKVKGSQLGNLG
jgi:hypothetical protein